MHALYSNSMAFSIKLASDFQSSAILPCLPIALDHSLTPRFHCGIYSLHLNQQKHTQDLSFGCSCIILLNCLSIILSLHKMFPIMLIFSMPINSSFKWSDSCEDLTEEQLYELILHCHSATAAFFSKLLSWYYLSKNNELDSYYKIIQQCINHIKRGFVKDYMPQLHNIHKFLTYFNDDEAECIKTFLWLILKIINWFYILLILCALNKHKINKLNKDSHIKITKFIIKWYESFFYLKLEKQIKVCKFE